MSGKTFKGWACPVFHAMQGEQGRARIPAEVAHPACLGIPVLKGGLVLGGATVWGLRGA